MVDLDIPKISTRFFGGIWEQQLKIKDLRKGEFCGSLWRRDLNPSTIV
jgi:hypothetical protein